MFCNVALFCETDAQFPVPDFDFNVFYDIKRYFKRNRDDLEGSKLLDTIEDITNLIKELDKDYVVRGEDDWTKKYRLEVVLNEYEEGLSHQLVGHFDLAMSKQFLRHLLRVREDVLGNTGDIITTWTTIDSLDYELGLSSCADIMCVDKTNNVYSPQLPSDAFDAALLRSCDAYVNISVVLKSMKPLSILAFKSLRGIQTNVDDYWGQESQVNPLVESGVLVHVGGNYSVPRSGVVQDSSVVVFLYVPNSNVSGVPTLVSALRNACINTVEYANWKQECRKFHLHK